MPEQDLIRVARENVEAFNAGDWDRFKATLAPDSIDDEVATGRRAQGPDQIAQNAQGWKQAFPDARGTVTSAFASGNTVTLEITWEGTHNGALQGPAGSIPASGKRISVRAAQVITFAGDKMKESRHYFDMMALLAQIGAIPQPQQV